jgi:hypothetical protein
MYILRHMHQFSGCLMDSETSPYLLPKLSIARCTSNTQSPNVLYTHYIYVLIYPYHEIFICNSKTHHYKLSDSFAQPPDTIRYLVNGLNDDI